MKTKILIVEDSQTLNENINEVLELYGYQLSASLSNADSAMEVILSEKPDLVLLDIKLKGMKSGVELAEEIRDTIKVPIVFITSYAGKEVIDRIKHTLPDGIVTKPFTFEALITSMELALANFKN